jgi:hypothetical protein
MNHLRADVAAATKLFSVDSALDQLAWIPAEIKKE